MFTAVAFHRSHNAKTWRSSASSPVRCFLLCFLQLTSRLCPQRCKRRLVVEWVQARREHEHQWKSEELHESTCRFPDTLKNISIFVWTFIMLDAVDFQPMHTNKQTNTKNKNVHNLLSVDSASLCVWWRLRGLHPQAPPLESLCRSLTGLAGYL